MSEDRQLEPGAGPVLGDYPPVDREWTFMVYMAGDNNLEGFGRRDLVEMKQVGSSPQVAIVVQFDSMSYGPTQRYYVRAGTLLESDVVETVADDTNTGDPRELAEFILWAMRAYPAKRYALVLWNHGTGWKEDDIYRARARGAGRSCAHAPLASLIEQWSRVEGRSALFATTLDTIMARGIAYDDTSQDFLDNIEMRRAIDSALLLSGTPRLALLGFDACLMSMLEVVYQVRMLADYVVGSQETEPGTGWPYTPILGALVDRPDMGGDELSAVIVGAYASYYGQSEPITQSALSSAEIAPIVEAVDDLCGYVLDHPELPCDVVIGRATRAAQRFSDEDYKDLYDLCEQIAKRSDRLPGLKTRAEAIMALLVPPGPGRFVHAEAHTGAPLSRSHGVSIYYPRSGMSPFYKRLDFASDSRWDEMLHFLLGI